jgi:hypothetical protein
LSRLRIGDINVRSFVAEKHVVCASSTLVRLEKRYIAEHLDHLVTFWQNYLFVGPKPEELGGSL